MNTTPDRQPPSSEDGEKPQDASSPAAPEATKPQPAAKPGPNAGGGAGPKPAQGGPRPGMGQGQGKGPGGQGNVRPMQGGGMGGGMKRPGGGGGPNGGANAQGRPKMVDPQAPPKNIGEIKALAQRVANPAAIKDRHRGLALAFLLAVALPIFLTASYLYVWAADQYSSTLAFTMRSEDSSSSASDLLGGLSTTLGGSSSASDSDVLYEFIRSQDMVRAVDAQVNLRELYSRPESDILLSFDPSGTIEDMTEYWQRMIRISYDSSSGLTELRILGFRPEDAKAIADAVQAEATRMVNDLSTTAREDAIRYAREDLDTAVERLKEAREALTAFRIENQIVDINADLQGQTGIVSTLQAQLANALVDLDLLQSSTRADDPRVLQAERRIEVIRERIASERQKFSGSDATSAGANYAVVVAEFERLNVDREFAETAYTTSLASYDAAVAEANRRTKYLAAYITPSVAEKSLYPQRGMITGLVGLFAFLLWAIGSLVYYSLRDRR